MNKSFEQLTNHFLRLYRRQTNGLPDNALISAAMLSAETQVEKFYLSIMFHAIDDLLSTYQTVKHVAGIHDEQKKLVKYITTVTLAENNASTVYTVIKEVDDDDIEHMLSSIKVREHHYAVSKLWSYERKASAESMRITSNEKKEKQKWKEIAERCEDPVTMPPKSFEDFINWLKEQGFDKDGASKSDGSLVDC